MRVGGGVDDNAVELAIGGLDHVDEVPLVVGLEAAALREARLAGGRAAKAHEVGIGLATVDLGLAHAEHVDVGTVDHQEAVCTSGIRCLEERGELLHVIRVIIIDCGGINVC